MAIRSSNELPGVGDVIAFRYVWSYEKKKKGRYPRPCVVVDVDLSSEPPTVTVIPISSKKPADGSGIELSSTALATLGLTKRSWILPIEANETVWPGYHLEPVPPGAEAAGPPWRYGVIGPALLMAVAAQIEALEAEGNFPITTRG